MSNRGFKGFRKPQQITDDALKASIERMSGIKGRYIYWTGDAYKARSASLRSNSLACLSEKKRPVALVDWITRAARVVSKEVGYSPERVREGLYLHRNSKPAVFFELERDAKGNWVSVNDVPNASGFPKGLKRGDVVVAAKPKGEAKQLPKGKGQAAPAPKGEGEQSLVVQ
jgi:hypothetical protein